MTAPEARHRLRLLLQQAIAGAEADAEHLLRTVEGDSVVKRDQRQAEARIAKGAANRLRDIMRDLELDHA